MNNGFLELKATTDYNLCKLYPELARQWHSTNNKDLTPFDVTPGSDLKVWWRCNQGRDHEWQASVVNRKGGRGCPYCAGKKTSKDNNLAVKNPELAKEWHPLKNGKLKPEQVTPGSERKVWWLCSRGHEWEAVIYSRNHGNSCPYCSGRKVGEDNNLAVK